MCLIIVILTWACGGAPEPLPTVPPQAHHTTPTPTLIPGPAAGSHVVLVPSGMFRAPTPTPVLSERLAAASAAYASAWMLTPQEFVEVIAEAGWPPHLHGQALSVAMCESGLSPWAINRSDQPDGLGSTGLFQMWSGWYLAAGYSYEQWRDPLVNAATALYVYGRSGWAPWACRP